MQIQSILHHNCCRILPVHPVKACSLFGVGSSGCWCVGCLVQQLQTRAMGHCTHPTVVRPSLWVLCSTTCATQYLNRFLFTLSCLGLINVPSEVTQSPLRFARRVVGSLIMFSENASWSYRYVIWPHSRRQSLWHQGDRTFVQYMYSPTLLTTCAHPCPSEIVEVRMHALDGRMWPVTGTLQAQVQG